ncbi:MAG: hypothetical protein JSW64_01085 [Candidatus Zixiibacteriota bacterium]|nr:MAG: hypothetical protein JSW64_01085 [candidate division Zixibacteria bacterium]
MKKPRIGSQQRILSLLSFIAIALVLVCVCNPPEFCCLEYDRNSAEMTYCLDHSGVAGNFLLDAEEQSDSALNETLEQLEDFYQEADTCKDAECIEAMIRADSDLAGMVTYYEDEHGAAEESLAEREIVFTDLKKAQLILCGFQDAVERTKENIKKGR